MKPALTPEEWRGVCVEGECRADGVWALTSRWTPVPNGPPFEDDEGNDLRVEPNYHALAALALHGQPFGFRHEDVRRLREAIVPEKWEPRADEDETDALHTIADRIEALLPPEEKAVGFSDFPVVNGREVQPGEVFDVYESRWPPEEK